MTTVGGGYSPPTTAFKTNRVLLGDDAPVQLHAAAVAKEQHAAVC